MGLCFRAALCGVACAVFLLPGAELRSQDSPGTTNVVIAAGVPLRVSVTRRTKLKRGAPVEGVLLEPVYVGTQLVLPKDSRVRGVVSATPPASRSVRVWAMLDGDFTPLHDPVVNFDQVELPSQQRVRLETVAVMRNGAIVRSAPRSKKTLWKQLKALVGDSLKGVKQQATGPHKSDRLLRLLYGQLPYHPQRLWADSAFDADLTTQATVEVTKAPLAELAAKPTIHSDLPMIKARFARGVSSKTAKPGEPVQAIVTEPVYDTQHLLLVSEGSTLDGVVLQARPARSFARNGSLRFVFRSVQDKTSPMQAVQGTLTAAESSNSSNLSIDDEGGAHAQDRHRLLAPLVLGVLAAAGQFGDGAAQKGAASNGVGLIARIAVFASGSQNLAAGFGSYALAKSIVRHFIVKGHEVEFPRDTRIEAVLSVK